jgi:hypothetical protein
VVRLREGNSCWALAAHRGGERKSSNVRIDKQNCDTSDVQVTQNWITYIHISDSRESLAWNALALETVRDDGAVKRAVVW